MFFKNGPNLNNNENLLIRKDGQMAGVIQEPAEKLVLANGEDLMYFSKEVSL